LSNGGGASPVSSGGSSATVATASTPLGTILVDRAGDTLYLFLQDKGSTSTCYGDCAANWPALVVTGHPTAASGISASALGTTTRTDGSMQVTLDGHPLYTYAGDAAPGQTNGEGLFGAWFAVSPTGSAVQPQASSTGSTGARAGY
jgi:predicted lipoprotein with Yx(FWY)xxD motif